MGEAGGGSLLCVLVDVTDNALINCPTETADLGLYA